jgi:hypothetical protein
LLRDVYQHSNADAGRLTNSRVFFTDPFTRWAVFVYGQDMHIPHHLFPAVPHYRLRQLHELLKRNHEAYRNQVVETYGTFYNSRGDRTILDEMTRHPAAVETKETRVPTTEPVALPRRSRTAPIRGVFSRIDMLLFDLTGLLTYFQTIPRRRKTGDSGSEGVDSTAGK